MQLASALLPEESSLKARFARSSGEGRKETRSSVKSERLSLARSMEISPDTRLPPLYQQKPVERIPYNDSAERPLSRREAAKLQKAQKSRGISAAEEVRGLPDVIVPVKTGSNILERLSERRRGRHDEALNSMYHELACVSRETEPLVLEPGKFLQAKLMESDRKIELLFKQIELDTALEHFSMEGLEELWNNIHQESLTRRKWIREMDESLRKVERNRADKVTDVLQKFTVKLEDIAFFLPADVHRLVNDEAMKFNRALLANQRAIAKMVLNLMKSETKKESSHQLKWQDRVKDWKLIQKNYIVHGFREFMANEEIQNPPTVKTEMDNMKMDQILLSERRLKFLQHLCDLLPPKHTKADIKEWYSSLVNLNKSIDTQNTQCVMKIRSRYEMVLQKCLVEIESCKKNLLNVCTKEEAEEVVNSEFLPLTEKLQSQFGEELDRMARDFKALAEQNEWNCSNLYTYFQEAMGLWDVHQLKLSQQEAGLQKRLDECRQKQNKLIQVMEANLDIILDEMRTASCEKTLNKNWEKALSSLDDIRAKYETFKQALTDQVMAYPEAVLQELISYSISISRYFDVKEIFKQSLQEETDFVDQGQGSTSVVQTVKTLEDEHLVEQQDESIVQENEGKEETESCPRETEGNNTAESGDIFAQETKETEGSEDGDSIPRGSEDTEHTEQGISFTQVMLNNSMAESSNIAFETFSTSSGNTYTVLGAEEAGETGSPETSLTKYEQKESLPMYLEYIVIKETMFVELKKRIRLCFFEHLEKWFATALSSSRVVVDAKKEELISELKQHLCLHQQKQEYIKTSICNVRAAELLQHKEHLQSHCAAVEEALRKERDELLKFCDDQIKIKKNLDSRISDMESMLLNAPMNEKLISFSNNLHSELHSQLEVLQDSLTSYQKCLEDNLGKLRDSNMNFLKGCRSFLKGGNFSPEEVKSISKRLEEERKSIDAFESLIKEVLEQVESCCLQQATSLINQTETKFRGVFTNRTFMGKMQQILRYIRLQIKSEVQNSNLQAVTLKSYLKKLHQKTDACAHPAADKEALTYEELFDFTKVVLKELKKRSQYLDCLVVKATSSPDNEGCTSLATDVSLQGPIALAIRRQHLGDENKEGCTSLATDVALQGPIALAIRGEHLGDENKESCTSLATDVSLQGPTALAIQGEHLGDENKGMVMGMDPAKYPLLSPSRRGKSALDDLAISLIKNLLGIQPSEKSLSQDQERKDRSGSLGQGPQESAAQATETSSRKKKKQTKKKKKDTKSVLSDKTWQVFGEEPPESNTFKGAIMNILWKGNRSLLCLAEEFYQNQNPQIAMPGELPETFERCAEILKQSLLSYQRQTDHYYDCCLSDFQKQVKLLEKELPRVSQVAAESLLKEHEQKLSNSTAQIRHCFSKELEGWENAKALYRSRLHPSLGHQENSLQLDTLCQKELKRQKDQADGIRLNTQKLRDCATECAQNFVSALAAFTEKLLLELDEIITIADIQVAKTETPREKASTSPGRKQAGPPLETSEVKQLIDHGSRTWPGIPVTTLTDGSGYILCRETASVTTAKTTWGHMAAVEARDAVYKKYRCKLEQQFAWIKEDSAAQLLCAQRWEAWWKRSIQKIKKFYM